MRNVARREVARHLASVELVLKRDLYREPRECDGPEGSELGTDACNPCDEEVRAGEIEDRRVDEGSDRGGSVDLGLSGDELADGSVPCAVGLGEEGGESRNSDVVLQYVEFGDAMPRVPF